MKTKRLLFPMLALSCLRVASAAPAAPAATDDPFIAQPESRTSEPTPEENEQNQPRHVSVLFETFSMDAAEAATLLRSGLEGKGLYDRILQKVEKKEAVQEALIVARGRSGERCRVQGISEQIYPTSFQRPFVPKPGSPLPVETGKGVAPASSDNTPGGPVPACPTSFETRDAGWTLEMEPTLGGSNKIIDLRLAPRYIEKAGVSTSGAGLAKTEMPVYETQKLETAVTIRPNVPFFMGTLNRTPLSQLDPQASKRVWFSFVTATVVTATGVVMR